MVELQLLLSNGGTLSNFTRTQQLSHVPVSDPKSRRWKPAEPQNGIPAERVVSKTIEAQVIQILKMMTTSNEEKYDLLRQKVNLTDISRTSSSEETVGIW